ncbi:type II secretion system protein N [Pseudomonas sp. LFM046]|uniref:type II secretion system protein N n=1 Tax=Pseudomonas sp. LFM046 TaxID=1608357 RepID=UPI0005CFEB13|nr:type II secretion system protein N [Pseudomonas sp. LFM046]
MHASDSLHRLQRHAPAFVGALVVLAMGASFAWQTREWLRLVDTQAQIPEQQGARVATTQPLQNLEPIFGVAPAMAPSGPPPSTNLRLTLLGSFVHAGPDKSTAIIQYEGGKPRRFSAGEEITSGVKVHAVYRNRVEIERNGRLESLSFPAPHSRFTPAGGASEEPATDVIDDLSGLQEDNAAELRERMEKLRQQMEDPDSTTDDASTEQPQESE